MAHIGKLYRRLKHRDLSIRRPFGMTYLPERVKWETVNSQIFPGYFFRPGFQHSEPGDVDWANGTVTYRIIPAANWTAGLEARILRKLSFTETWNTDQVWLGVSGVDRAWIQQTGPPASSSDFSISGPMNLIPPWTSSFDFFVTSGTALVWADE